MKRIECLIVFFYLIFSALLFAQQDDEVGSRQQLIEGSGTALMTTAKSGGKIVGSPYRNETFETAKVSGSSQSIYNVRYNAYNDEFEVKLEDNNIKNINKNLENLTVKMINTNIIFTAIDYLNDDKKERGFFILLNSDPNKIQLYKKVSKRFVEEKPARSSYDKGKPAEFKENNVRYFINTDSAYPEEIPRNKKDFVKLFPSHTKEIANFIKAHNIKTNNDQDLIKVINYISTL